MSRDTVLRRGKLTLRYPGICDGEHSTSNIAYCIERDFVRLQVKKEKIFLARSVQTRFLSCKQWRPERWLRLWSRSTRSGKCG